jgi:hypothetical protein
MKEQLISTYQDDKNHKDLPKEDLLLRVCVCQLQKLS